MKSDFWLSKSLKNSKLLCGIELTLIIIKNNNYNNNKNNIGQYFSGESLTTKKQIIFFELLFSESSREITSLEKNNIFIYLLPSKISIRVAVKFDFCAQHLV